MDKVKDIHIFGSIFSLMIMRVFGTGKWFSCVVYAGLLVALFDLISKLYKSNMTLVDKKHMIRYGGYFVALNFIFGIGCILIFLNLILEIPWLNDVALLDEITLLTLLLTLPQKLILEKINKEIRK